MTFPTTQISISINCPPNEVYKFASNPKNLPQWASGLSNNVITKKENFWVTDSPMGEVKIQFAPQNDFGVMDHDVMLPNGEINHNPFRVMKNDNGSEVVFTLFKLPTTTEEDYKKDAELVRTDLRKLKSILENR